MEGYEEQASPSDSDHVPALTPGCLPSWGSPQVAGLEHPALIAESTL